MNLFCKALTSVMVSFSLVSCSSGDGNDTSLGGTDETIAGVIDGTISGITDSGQIADFTSDPSWSIGEFTYGGPLSSSAANNTDGSTGTVSASTLGVDTSNGAYSGSRVTIAHTLNGSGEYTVLATFTDLVNVFSQDPNASVVSIFATAGLLNTNPSTVSRYDATSGTVTVFVDSNGRYHFTTSSALPFVKTTVPGTDIPGSPDQLEFEMTNVFSR